MLHGLHGMPAVPLPFETVPAAAPVDDMALGAMELPPDDWDDVVHSAMEGGSTVATDAASMALSEANASEMDGASDDAGEDDGASDDGASDDGAFEDADCFVDHHEWSLPARTRVPKARKTRVFSIPMDYAY